MRKSGSDCACFSEGPRGAQSAAQRAYERGGQRHASVRLIRPSARADSLLVSTTADVILASGPIVVALAAIGAAVWQQRRGFGHEREMADLADTRSLFDEAVVALRHSDDMRHRATQALFSQGSWTGERAPEAVAAVGVAATALAPLRDRMAVRLGLDHEAVEGFNRVILTLREVAHLLSMPSEYADAREGWNATKVAAEEFKAAQAAFFSYAVRAVGSKLP